VLSLSIPGGRRAGTASHDEAVRRIGSAMARTGLRPYRGDGFGMPYAGRDPAFGPEIVCTNLAGILPGSDPRAAPLLLGAHYDSFLEAPSTDDNAASVAVLLEVARRASGLPRRRGIAFVLFDAEESPFFGTDGMGSARFLADQASEIPSCAVILDMVGHPAETGSRLADLLCPAFREFLFVTGAESSVALPAALEAAALRTPGLRVVPTLNRYVGDTSDHGPFRRAGIPFLFVSSGPGRCSHAPCDTPDYVSIPRLAGIAELVLGLCGILDAAEIGSAGSDTAELECRMLRRAAGPVLPLVLRVLGLPGRLRDRGDLDRLAARLGERIRMRSGG